MAVHYKGSGFYSTDYGRGSRKGASKDGDGGGSGEKSDSGDKKEPDEGLRLGRQEDRRRGLSAGSQPAVADRRTPARREAPSAAASGAERPVNIAIVATLSSEPKMTDWPSALPGSPPSRQWSALLRVRPEVGPAELDAPGPR